MENEVCLGTRHSAAIIKTVSSNKSDSNARPGIEGMDNILARLMETPTNISPVKAAAAPAMATKKSLHSFIQDDL